jgi:hypothetical protein
VIRKKRRKFVFQGGMKEAEMKPLIAWQAHGKRKCISDSSSLKEILFLAGSTITGHQQNLFQFSGATDLTPVRQRCRENRSRGT